MHRKTRMFIIAFLGITVILLANFTFVSSQRTLTLENVRGKIFYVYERVIYAYKSGANVSNAVKLLNNAINDMERYVKTNDTDLLLKSENLVNQVNSSIPRLIEEGRNTVFWSNIILVSSLIIFIVVIVLGYLYLPKLIFRTWLRIRKGYKIIVRKEKSSRRSLIIDEEVWAVILAIILVGGIFAVSQAYLSNRVVEPFSELGLLGKNMKIGDYPRQLVVGENATFYVYVGNHMGRPMYYIVEVKLGDNETGINPCPLKPIYTYEKILMNNGTWIFRVDLPVKKPGLNQRIIVELWVYNDTIHSIQYHKRWTQLWINVTSL